MRKVDLTLAQRANKAVANGLETTNLVLDVVALSARATRDLAFTTASRAAKLAKAEKVDPDLFKEVDSMVDAALGR